MEEMVHVYFFGKQYEVPGSLTIMRAMEYAGYQLVRGCGCRNGFCGACATLYRVKGKQELKSCLACQTQVEEGMYVATLPFFPLVKQVYDMENIPLNQQVMMQLYPLQCLHQMLHPGAECDAVHCLCSAGRLCRLRRGVL